LKKAIRKTEICKQQAQKTSKFQVKQAQKQATRKSTKSKPKFAGKPQGWQHCCRGKLRNLRAYYFSVGLYCVTTSWQRIFTCSLQVTIVLVGMGGGTFFKVGGTSALQKTIEHF